MWCRCGVSVHDRVLFIVSGREEQVKCRVNDRLFVLGLRHIELLMRQVLQENQRCFEQHHILCGLVKLQTLVSENVQVPC